MYNGKIEKLESEADALRDQAAHADECILLMSPRWLSDCDFMSRADVRSAIAAGLVAYPEIDSVVGTAD